MYTELHFNARLREDVPAAVVEVLKAMVGESEQIPPLPDHRLFTMDRWRWMLQCDSYYFDADTHSTLRFDDIAHSYFLCIRTNLKNYCWRDRSVCRMDHAVSG